MTEVVETQDVAVEEAVQAEQPETPSVEDLAKGILNKFSEEMFPYLVRQLRLDINQEISDKYFEHKVESMKQLAGAGIGFELELAAHVATLRHAINVVEAHGQQKVPSVLEGEVDGEWVEVKGEDVKEGMKLRVRRTDTDELLKDEDGSEFFEVASSPFVEDGVWKIDLGEGRILTIVAQQEEEAEKEAA